jgi:histone H1/5
MARHREVVMGHQLTDIEGIGPAMAARLIAAGIDSVAALGSADAAAVAAVQGLGASRGAAVQNAARLLLNPVVEAAVSLPPTPKEPVPAKENVWTVRAEPAPVAVAPHIEPNEETANEPAVAVEATKDDEVEKSTEPSAQKTTAEEVKKKKKKKKKKKNKNKKKPKKAKEAKMAKKSKKAKKAKKAEKAKRAEKAKKAKKAKKSKKSKKSKKK